MKLRRIYLILLPLLMLTGCGPVGEKSSSLVLLYAATAVLAALMLLGYFLLGKLRLIYLQLIIQSILLLV